MAKKTDLLGGLIKQGKKEIKIEDIKKPGPTLPDKAPKPKLSVLDKLRSSDKPKTSSIKLDTDIYNQLKDIAHTEGIDRTGHLIKAILEDWIKQYKG